MTIFLSNKIFKHPLFSSHVETLGNHVNIAIPATIIKFCCQVDALILVFLAIQSTQKLVFSVNKNALTLPTCLFSDLAVL